MAYKNYRFVVPADELARIKATLPADNSVKVACQRVAKNLVLPTNYLRFGPY